MRDLDAKIVITILRVNGLYMVMYDYIEAGEIYGRIGTRLFTFVIWECEGRGVIFLYLCYLLYTFLVVFK